MFLAFTSQTDSLHVKLPTNSFIGTVDWGDGQTETFDGTTRPEHTYSGIDGAGSSYGVCLDGTADKFGIDRELDGTNHFVQSGWFGSDSLVEVLQWGNLGANFTDLQDAFQEASNLLSVPDSLPATVTNIAGIFRGASKFNDAAVSTWDTSSVTDMSYAFDGASAFNQDITAWDTRNVLDMSYMFWNASSFNQDINYEPSTGAWDTSNVTNMSYMFSGASAFNGNISYWITSSVNTTPQQSWEGMSNMFNGAEAFNQDITTKTVDPTGAGDANFEAWNVGTVSDMSNMFDGATSFNQPIGNWDTSHVYDMHRMFHGNFDSDDALITPAAFNQDISGWATGNVADMRGMFSGATDFNQPIGAWNTGNVLSMSGMFWGATAFNQAIGAWDTSKVRDMSYMFANLTDGEDYFVAEGHFNQNISAWDTRNVMDMSYMFWGANSFDDGGVNLNFDSGAAGSWNTGNVRDMSHMFHGAVSFDHAIDRWNTSRVESMSYMFAGASWMDGLRKSCFDERLADWNTSSVTDMSGMFADNSSFNQDIDRDLQEGTWNTSSVTDMSSMLAGASAFNQDISGWNTSNVSSMANMFDGASAFNQDLRYIPATRGTPSQWDTSNVIEMTAMFEGATSFNGDISNWNTGKVTQMGYMFMGRYTDDSSSLLDATIFNRDISAWDTHAVVDMHLMFAGDTAFNQDITRWDVGHVYTVDHMFMDARVFNQPIGAWHFTQLENLSGTFQRAIAFNQDLSLWDTSGVRAVADAFNGASAFNQDISNWNLGEVGSALNMLDNSSMSRLNFSYLLRSLASGPHGTDGIRTLGAANIGHLSTVNGDIQRLVNDGWVIADNDAGGWAAATPNIMSAPQPTGILASQTLSASSLSGGSASVPGSFAFSAPGASLPPGVQPVMVTFTPRDSTANESVTTTVSITVSAAPHLHRDPTVLGTATVGKSLTAGFGMWESYPLPTLTIQWYRCTKAVAPHLTAVPKAAKCIAIKKATSARYKVTTADRSKYLVVLTKSRNSLGTAYATSASTSKVR